MKKIKDLYKNEIVINKSRFIATIYRVNSVDEVNDILTKTKKKYYDATHNCYAYIIGENQNIQKCSDDGEPSKTAGMPILDALKYNNLTNILCIVTRYFGGILLGAGGLVRAYSDATSSVLKLAQFYETKLLKKIKIRLDYSSYNMILNTINKYYILDTIFTNDVLVILGINPIDYNNLCDYLNNITSGNVIITEDEIYTIEVPILNT